MSPPAQPSSSVSAAKRKTLSTALRETCNSITHDTAPEGTSNTCTDKMLTSGAGETTARWRSVAGSQLTRDLFRVTGLSMTRMAATISEGSGKSGIELRQEADDDILRGHVKIPADRYVGSWVPRCGASILMNETGSQSSQAQHAGRLQQPADAPAIPTRQ